MNWLVVAGVIVAFFFQVMAMADSTGLEKVNSFVLDGWGIRGIFGHMWLHAGLFHLIGNLIFLWLFGNAVCSKIGNVLYLPVYVGLGLVAAASHQILVGGSAIGASGAINGIVGMYLVFFPENSISFVFLLFFPPFFIFRPFFFSVSGYWLILLWFAFDLFGALSGSGSVAYVAHIGGFLGGLGLAILMLKKKWIVMERYERSIFELFSPKQKSVSGIPREELEYWRRKLKRSKGKQSKPAASLLESRTARSKPVRQAPALGQAGRAGEPIHFTCSCGQMIQIGREHAGKTGRCPKCSARIKIPER